MRCGHRGLVLLLVLSAAATALAKDRRPEPRDGFRDAVAVVTPSGEPAHPECWPEELVARRDWRGTPEQVSAWRRDAVARLASAQVKKVRPDGERALVRVRYARGEAELPLSWSEARWVVDAPEEWLVRGTGLDDANGSRPASLRLTARTTGGPYGTSAFSFAHVTQDAELCLNRLDLWYCHNGDLHVVGDGGLVEIGKGRLGKADEIPAGAVWDGTVHPRKGFVYVLHALRRGHRDFFVRLRVTALAAEAVELEWELLSLGEGAPKTIHEAQPWQASEPGMGKPGTDGCAGLCGKNG